MGIKTSQLRDAFPKSNYGRKFRRNEILSNAPHNLSFLKISSLTSSGKL